MVTQEVASQLDHAAWLLKNGDRVEAYRILKSLVRQDPVDWRAWWGLVHATPNPEERLTALRKTLQFNPHHTKAAELLRQAEGKLTRSAPVKPGTLHQHHAAPPPAPPTPTAPFVNPPFADTSTPSAPVFLEPDPGDDAEPIFPAYEIIESKPQAWESETSEPEKEARKTSANKGGTDRFVNIAIIIVGVLVVAGILGIVLTQFV